MHISGTIAAWLVAVGIVVGVYFSAKALAVRDAWMQVAQKNEAEIKKNDEEISKRVRLLDEKRNLLARTMLGWDRYWTDVPGVLNADGTISLQMGSGRGIQQDQLLYVFAPNQDGTSVYVGDFKVVRAAENATMAKPASRRRANEPKLTGAPVRVRTQLPNQYLTHLQALDQQLLAAELQIATNNEELARQGQLLNQSDKLIAARMAELNGDPALQGKEIPDVNVNGLLTSIVEEEEARNAALIEADRMTHELYQTRQDFLETLKANRGLVESLPQPAPQEPAVGAAGR